MRGGCRHIKTYRDIEFKDSKSLFYCKLLVVYKKIDRNIDRAGGLWLSSFILFQLVYYYWLPLIDLLTIRSSSLNVKRKPFHLINIDRWFIGSQFVTREHLKNEHYNNEKKKRFLCRYWEWKRFWILFLLIQ